MRLVLACSPIDFAAPALEHGYVQFGRGMQRPAFELATGDAVVFYVRASVRRALPEPLLAGVGRVVDGDAYRAPDGAASAWRRDVQWLCDQAVEFRALRGLACLPPERDEPVFAAGRLLLGAEDFWRIYAVLDAPLPPPESLGVPPPPTTQAARDALVTRYRRPELRGGLAWLQPVAEAPLAPVGRPPARDPLLPAGRRLPA
jgi:hypothetical protein